MVEPALAQLRFAGSVVLGRPCPPWALERLIVAARDIRREFGSLGQDGAGLLGGPALDEETRAALYLRRFRAQAMHAAHETPYYGRLFEGLGLDPARLRAEDLPRISVTLKEAARTALFAPAVTGA
jgi:hypothetical protein